MFYNMNMRPEEFIKKHNITLRHVTGCSYSMAHPDLYYYVKNKKGDTKHSFFYNIFGFEIPFMKHNTYKYDVIVHKYMDYEKNEINAKFDILNNPKYMWVEGRDYPVWFKPSIVLYWDNGGSTTYYDAQLTVEDCMNIQNFILTNYS